MPIVRVELLEGRPMEKKRELAERVAEAVAQTLGIDQGRVRVLLYELPPEHWTVGGTPLTAVAPHD